ncbi:MAG: UvrD-helicase domain-containing protein [Alphaproteobacteria bacterium]|nr:UvrD-helicase domain-containing protein [Alphaproteobacteria bacterium]
MTDKPKLSLDQDRAANPTNNVWVQANAGTGKTSVLVQRLLRILFRSSDCSKSGILCLTYTNAGAGEMRNRILKALRTWAVSTDTELAELLDGVSLNHPVTKADIEHARQIFFYYIDHPDILKIKTIHGFCEEILHRFPLEAGISPSWSLVSDAAQRVLLAETFEHLINSPKTDDRTNAAFAHIVGRVSEKSMSDLLNILSDQYKQFFTINDRVKYREYFVDTTRKYLDIDNVPQMEISASELQNIIDSVESDQNHIKKPTKTLNELVRITKQFINNTVDFEEYKFAYLTGSFTPIVTVSKRDYLVPEQQRVYAVHQYNANKKMFEDTVALFDLSSAFADEYLAQKRLRNLLDFDDLILYTRKLFSNRETMGWVLSQLDLSLSHILVDEAQDTSPMQWDILRMLAGDFFADGDTTGHTHSMFVVGDTKQSIYGFQGADPHAFAASRTEIASQLENSMRTICEIPLAQSFRSTAPILETVDRFFSDAGVIELSGFVNNTHKCFRVNDVGAVEIHKLAAKQADDGTETTVEQYIERIANKIESMIKSGKCTPADIMILVQKRHPMASPLLKALKRKNIDVAGSDRVVLPDFPAIRDLLNLTRFCINPSDDYSLCCVLKSPLFYLTEVDIFNLCNERNNQNLSNKDDTKKSRQVTIFDILLTMYPKIHTRMIEIIKWSKYMAPYTFFSNVLDTDGTRQKFISALGRQVIDPLEEFMTICLAYERTQPGLLYQFIKWFITGGSEIKRDMDASSGVRIVTVHGSKGLESKVVFLIDTIHTPKAERVLPIPSDDYPIWLWTARGEGSEKYKSAAALSRESQMAEYYRLLYVAMTRARDELYIYGHTPNKNTTPDSWHAHLWRVFTGENLENRTYIRITNGTENIDSDNQEH